MEEPNEETEDMKRAGMLSVDAPVPTEDGDNGATSFSEWGGPGEETWGPEMDCLICGPGIPHTVGDEGEGTDVLDVGMEGTSGSTT